MTTRDDLLPGGWLSPLKALIPEADVPMDATVSYLDACLLSDDLLLTGNAFVRPSGRELPSHVRIPPDAVELTA